MPQEMHRPRETLPQIGQYNQMPDSCQAEREFPSCTVFKRVCTINGDQCIKGGSFVHLIHPL